MVVRCRDYIALYFFVVIAVSTIEVATAQEQLGSPSDQVDHDLGASVAVGSGDLKGCASNKFGCSVPEVLEFAKAQLRHCAPLFTAKAQVVLATKKGQRAILEQLGEDLDDDDEGEWSRSRMRVSSRGTRKTDELMLGEGGRSKLQKGGTTASSEGPLPRNSGTNSWKYEALDLDKWMKLHSQIAILKKESGQKVKTDIQGMKIAFKFTINPRKLKTMFKNLGEIDQNLGKTKKAYKMQFALENIKAWSRSVVFVSSKAETEKAKIIAAAYDAKARAKARKASAAGTHFRSAAVHGLRGPKAADHGTKAAAVHRPKDEQHESRQTQRAQQAVAKSGRRQWRHRSKTRSRSASKNQGKISCVTPHGAIADCSKDPAAVKAALKIVIKAGHKVDKMLGSSDGCATKHGDVADCSQAVSRLKGRQISQQLGEDDDEFGQSLSNSRIIKGFNVKRLLRKGKKKKGKKKQKGKKKAKPAAATTSNDLFASCRSLCSNSLKPQPGVVERIKAIQAQPASKKKGLRTILKQLGEDLDGDEDDFSRSRMNSRGRRKADESMLGEGTKKKKKDPFTKAVGKVSKPVTEESLTKQCNDGSLLKVAQLFCSDDRSRGFGSSGCVQCQNQLCVKKNGPERCWRCSLLQEGNSLGFSCFRIAGAESTVCKSLITDEATQPWIGCRTEKPWTVPGQEFICRGRSKKKKEELGEGKLLPAPVGSTMTSPFPLFKEVQCTKAHGMQRCGVRKVNPCTHKDKKRSNMCKMGEDQISLTKAF